MAKVTLPLLSGSASGKFGNGLVFLRSRGRDIARILVIPANPRTAGQGEARSVYRIAGQAATRIFNDQVGKSNAEGAMTPLAYLLTRRMTGDTFSSAYIRFGYDQGRVTLTADVAAYAGLDPANVTLWENWNLAFTRPFDATVGAPGDPREFTAAFVGFSFARALFRAGYLDALPTDTPPVWDNSLQARVAGVRAQ